MRIVRSVDWQFRKDADGYLVFQHTRFPDEYLILRYCKFYDVEAGRAIVMSASSLGPDETVDQLKSLICSATS